MNSEDKVIDDIDRLVDWQLSKGESGQLDGIRREMCKIVDREGRTVWSGYILYADPPRSTLRDLLSRDVEFLDDLGC